jgi:hypothetical protein
MALRQRYVTSGARHELLHWLTAASVAHVAAWAKSGSVAMERQHDRRGHALVDRLVTGIAFCGFRARKNRARS